MKSSILKMSVLCAAALLAAAARADIRMPKIFSNSMVLQRGENVNVWGLAAPNAKVDVEFAGNKVSATADDKGKWLLKLPPMKASAQGAAMKIFENGKLGRTISDILVGEVWIAGGQSNMAFLLKNAAGAKELVSGANNSAIRYFDQGNKPFMRSLDGVGKYPLPDVQKGSRWLVCSPKNAEYSFRAVPYIFARDIAEKLGVPVGIVYTAVSGTRMGSWVPRADFEKNPDFAGAKAAYEKRLAEYDAEKAIAQFEDDVRAFPQRVEKAKAEGKRPPEKWTVSEDNRPWKDSPDKWSSPSLLYNIRIHPIRNFTARGVLWYQGEGDAGAPDFARQFGGLIKIWRRVFGKPDMPFVFAQLPSFGNSCWPKARAAQQQVADSEKNVYMATIIDTGSEKDIHPRDKLPVGKRLAAAALDKVYKIPGARSEGPKFASAEYSGNMAKVSFDTNGKLSFKGKPRGFEVLAGGKWVPATSARIAGNSVELFAADKAAKVSGARYLFMPWAKPFVCLFDDAGMPAHPFTTSK